MDDRLKKGINFDLDTNKLKQNYIKGDWHNAYYDLRMYLEKEGFEHIQGSGYHSMKPMTQSQAMSVIHKITKKFPWINECVRICTISDVPETTDISHVFEKEAERLQKVKTATKNIKNKKKNRLHKKV